MPQNRPPEPTTRTVPPPPAPAAGQWPMNSATAVGVDPTLLKATPDNGRGATDATQRINVRIDRPELLNQALRNLDRMRIETDHLTDSLPDWAEELKLWWINTAADDIGGSIEKIALYGGRGAAYDLIATGHDLAAMNGRAASDEEAGELAILFYLSSKVNRMLAAAIDGRRGSDDTLLDIVYYGMMARRNRETGGWPVASKEA